MSRIARVRIQWINTQQHDSKAVLTSPPANRTGGNLPVRQTGRVLHAFDLPNMRVQVSWTGWSSAGQAGSWMLGLLVIVLGILAWIRFTGDNSMETRFYTEKIDQLGLVSGDVILPDGTIRMHNSPLDIGQSKDVFDQDIETLIRGRDANPFILNFEFARPQAVRGLTMDLGRMDFVVRVQVYGTDGGPISYEAEYREQPPIPHVDLDFSSGPDPVSRIYIEIEQLDPPDEVHVHVREVVFKK